MRVVAPIEHLTALCRALRSSRERTRTERSAVGVHPVGQILLGCGILAAALYVAMIFAVGALWEGYSNASHTISELSAIGAPTRPLWILLGAVYTGLMIAFGWSVWSSAPPSRPQRVLGMVLMIHAAFGSFWPPMHQREVLSSGGGTLTDSLHIVWAAVTGLFFTLETGFGAAMLGWRFRLWSIATMAIGLACGAVTGTDASRIQANLPTPWVGTWERIGVVAYLLWIAVLATALLRARTAGAPTEVPTQSSARQPRVRRCRRCASRNGPAATTNQSSRSRRPSDRS